MRWSFLFVIALNIIYIGWNATSSDEVSERPESRDVPTIQLLSEIAPDEMITAEPAETKPPAKTEEKAAATKSSEQTAASVVTSSGNMCFTLGPFRELDALRDFTREIKDYVSAASFRSREETEQERYRVYIKPLPSFNDARAIGKQLQAKNFKEFFIINKGDEKNGISLGYFKRKDGAYSVYEKIKSFGLKPTISPVFNTITVYWLDYRVAEGKKVPESTFETYLSNKITRLDRPC